MGNVCSGIRAIGEEPTSAISSSTQTGFPAAVNSILSKMESQRSFGKILVQVGTVLGQVPRLSDRVNNNKTLLTLLSVASSFFC
jgi:hypothetical protein